MEKPKLQRPTVAKPVAKVAAMPARPQAQTPKIPGKSAVLAKDKADGQESKPQSMSDVLNAKSFRFQLAKTISFATSVAIASGMFLFFGKFLDVFASIMAAFVIWLFAGGILLYFYALGDM
ncbi:MAG TPA: hypothetical protein PLO51_00150 [Candidatus Micrarchaeota archaeon]|nr:hypothetical protein [Candidatus Micrarchaeota archaeon]